MKGEEFEMLIGKFLRDGMSDKEKSHFFSLIVSDDNFKRRYVESICDWINNYKDLPGDCEQRQRAYKRVLSSISSNNNLKKPAGSSSRRGGFYIHRTKSLRKSGFFRIASMVACVLLFLTLGYLAGIKNIQEDKNQKAVIEDSIETLRIGEPVAVPLKTELVVPRGSRASVILADGTKVWINADSRLSYTSDYPSGNRNVYLEGEAYFEVVRVEDKISKRNYLPFTVHTKNISIVAKGTAFNVDSYTDNVKTTLTAGSVTVSSENGETKVLKPNQSVEYISNSANFSQVEKVNTELYTSWKDERWIIRSMSLDEFASKLEKRYDVVIIFEDQSIKEKRITGTLSNETIEQIMMALKTSIYIDYCFNKNQITLKSSKNKILTN
jgi:hypothetical protein